MFSSCDDSDNDNDLLPDENKTPAIEESLNTNINSIVEKSAKRLEMPHIDAALFYAPHYITYESREIMNLAVEWNSTLRHATWVAFTWDSTTSQDNTSRGSAWKWDPEIPQSYNAVAESDHQSDGYDKGHLCASDDRAYCTDANNQTFYHSNISPQLSSFNQKFWARLEAKVQSWGRMTQTGEFDTIYVVKGGNLNSLLKNFTASSAGADKVIPYTDENGFSKGHLAVPDYYYMALLARKSDTYQAIAFYVPHIETLPTKPTSEDFKQFVISIDDLEKNVGIDFFCNLPDNVEKLVEKEVSLNKWNW